MANDMFEPGDTPYDHLVELTRLVETLVRSHNELAEDHVRLVDTVVKQRKKIAVLEARLDEIKRALLR